MDRNPAFVDEASAEPWPEEAVAKSRKTRGCALDRNPAFVDEASAEPWPERPVAKSRKTRGSALEIKGAVGKVGEHVTAATSHCKIATPYVANRVSTYPGDSSRRQLRCRTDFNFRCHHRSQEENPQVGAHSPILSRLSHPQTGPTDPDSAYVAL